MEIQRIRSVLFLWQKLSMFLALILFIICLVLFMPGKYGSKAYIDKFDVPIGFNVLGYFLTFLSFCFPMYLSITNWYKRDKLEFNARMLNYKGKDYLVTEMRDIKLLRHPLKFKPFENRTIFNGGGNNWLKFKYEGKKHEIEYFLGNKAEEDELNQVFQKWEHLTEIEYGVSEEQDLLELYDSLTFKTKYDKDTAWDYLK